MNESLLRPFRGFLTPGLYFSSNYCLWLLNFSSTPTDLGAYSEIWLITPEDKRILYVDPEAAGPIVGTFHNFHEMVGASVAWEWSASDTLHVDMKAMDETTLDLHLGLGSSLGTRILNPVLKITPQALMRSRPMVAISEISLNLLLGLGGLKIAGKTETGKAFLNEADRLAIVKEASARLNHEDLGALTRPPKPILFGDAKVPNCAFFSFGTLNLEYAKP
jgi:hypothetical protein